MFAMGHGSTEIFFKNSTLSQESIRWLAQLLFG
jgi:hypothetical protein